MKINLPDLPYKYDALEPYIDQLTMQIHHTKHHQAYVDNFNKAVDGLDINYDKAEELLLNIDKVPKDIRQNVINNAGGCVNHSFYWKIMTPVKSEPGGEFADLINKHFGSVDIFKQKFNDKALSLFGSGWVFMIMDKSGQLTLKRHSFQNSPISYGNVPIIGIDLWEHAYYLKYQNRRIEYINAWWNVMNWHQAEENYKNAIKK